MNIINVSGRIGTDPEVRFTANQKKVVDFRLAVTRRKKVGDAWEDETNWMTIVCYGYMADDAEVTLAKGDNIQVAGRINVREWEGQDGGKRTATEIVADEIAKSIRYAAVEAQKSGSTSSYSTDEF